MSNLTVISVFSLIDLQLHGDDVYFTLEDGDQRQNAAVSKVR